MSKLRTPITKMSHTINLLDKKLAGTCIARTNSKKESEKLLTELYPSIKSSTARSDQTVIFHSSDDLIISILSYYEDEENPTVLVINKLDHLDCQVSQLFCYKDFHSSLKNILKEGSHLNELDFVSFLISSFFTNDDYCPQKTNNFTGDDFLKRIENKSNIAQMSIGFFNSLSTKKNESKEITSDIDKKIENEYLMSSEFKDLELLRKKLEEAEVKANKKFKKISLKYLNKNKKLKDSQNMLLNDIRESILSFAYLFNDEKNKNDLAHSLIILIKSEIQEMINQYSEKLINEIPESTIAGFLKEASLINPKMNMIKAYKFDNLSKV